MTILRKELCCPGAMTLRWAPQTCHTLRRITKYNKKFDLTADAHVFLHKTCKKLRNNNKKLKFRFFFGVNACIFYIFIFLKKKKAFLFNACTCRVTDKVSILFKQTLNFSHTKRQNLGKSYSGPHYST